jgi:hypothetical protein
VKGPTLVIGAAGAVVIVESSEQPGPNGPQAVHVHGVQSVIAAAAPTVPIVLVTQIYITPPKRSSRGVHRPQPHAHR